MSNFRIDFPSDCSHCRILKTGAAVDSKAVWPSLKIARAVLEADAVARMAAIKRAAYDAVHTKDAALADDAPVRFHDAAPELAAAGGAWEGEWVEGVPTVLTNMTADDALLEPPPSLDRRGKRSAG